MTESNFGFSDSCTARTREDENLRKPQVKAAIEYRPHVREDAGPWRRDPDAWSGMPWAVVSVPVWRFESQMPKVLEKFRFVGRISKMA